MSYSIFVCIDIGLYDACSDSHTTAKQQTLM